MSLLFWCAVWLVAAVGAALAFGAMLHYNSKAGEIERRIQAKRNAERMDVLDRGDWR